MIKMFYLVYGLTSGGIERISVDIYKYLDHSKIDDQLITKYDNKEFFDDELEAYGGHRIPIQKISSRNGHFDKLHYLRNLVVILKDNYDIAYFCLSKPRDVFKYPLLCKLLGVKNIAIHSHNSLEDNNWFLNKILNALGRYIIGYIAQLKIACSEEAAEWMFPQNIIRNKDYFLMKNGIDVENYKFNQDIRNKMRQKYHCENDFVIGHVGRFTRQKNHKFLIEIFEQIQQKRKNSTLILIGTGELENSIKRYVIEKHFESNVIFCGEQRNINEYMEMFDAFVFPSLYEGLPVVGIEAQVSGLKCFFSDSITKEVNVTGNITYMSLNDSPEKWSNSIINSSFQYKREDCSQAVRKCGFDIQSSVKALENLIIKQCDRG